jgi:regulator of replication initiation timing
MHATVEKARADKAKTLRENEQIKKDNRQLLEETAKLVQENEQLKKDIQLLKSLEVQLEKREKMLR